MTKLLYIDTDPGALHIWVGPIGVYLFWPHLHKSRLDFCAKWNQEMA